MVARRILACFDKPFEAEGGTFALGASMGVSFYPQDGRDSVTLLKKADAAMYQAKARGGKGIFFSSDL